MKLRSGWRKIYEENYGLIPPKHEIHHIQPRFAGGTDDPSNLIAVTPQQHKYLHLDRYKEFGDFRDLCAYHMLDYNYSEAHRISSSMGGKIGGKILFHSGRGIFRSKEERKQWASKAGKIGGLVQRNKKLGIHGLSKEQRFLNASKGGKAGGFTMSHIQRENGKRGGCKNKGFIWINNGIQNFKYTKKLQFQQPLQDFLQEYQLFSVGRLDTVPPVTCPHCGKSGRKTAMVLHHFEKCKHKGQP